MLKITLRAARESCGYTKEEVAEHCGMPIKAFNEIEDDSMDTPISIIRKTLCLYGISAELIYFGTESDCIKHNRSNPQE